MRKDGKYRFVNTIQIGLTLAIIKDKYKMKERGANDISSFNYNLYINILYCKIKAFYL